MNKIISGSAPRLVFAIVDGTTGAAITDADETSISTAKYQTIGPSGQRSALSAHVGTLTAVASTASVIAGSFGAIDTSQGLYFIDFPALAALDSAHSVQAVIELVSGDNVALPVLHEIDAKTSTVNDKLTTDRLTKIDGAMQAGADGDTGKVLSDQIDGSRDLLGYMLAALAGTCSDAGTSAETYTITIGADTFTIDHTGLDATGNRGTATLTKS